MRSIARFAFPALLLLVSLAHPLYAAEQEEEEMAPRYFTLSGGWSWPAGGPVDETYDAGFTAAASFRTGLTANYMGGIEFGYTWYSLNSSNLAEENPGSTFSGGDLGLLSITTENDYLFGSPDKAMRPFLNLGIGYYKSFVDDATQTTGATTVPFATGIHESSFFGFHVGIGGLLSRDRYGLRLDANYEHLFAGGPDLEFFDVRGGIVFYLD
jgi:outer membrane protein W